MNLSALKKYLKKKQKKRKSLIENTDRILKTWQRIKELSQDETSKKACDKEILKLKKAIIKYRFNTLINLKIAE
jgi:hypothetical protein